MRLFMTLACLIGLSTGASAASLLETGTTAIGDTGNIVGISGASVSSSNPLYSTEATVPASDWVWIGDNFANEPASWRWDFDLAGFDPATASISGLWGMDGLMTVTLNGTEILTERNKFFSLVAFDYSGSAFVAGNNALIFDVTTNDSPPSAFRASLTLIADEAVDTPAIPLPASLPLALGGIAALGAVSRRARRGG